MVTFPLLVSVLVVGLYVGQCLGSVSKFAVCLDARHHKPKPGPESTLFQHCTPWKEESCCTENTTRSVHNTDMYSFSFDFCEKQTGVKMTPACRKHFHRDLCFYECEPNIGPWVVKVKRKIANERFYEVPLCESDCKTWWEDCLFDYACTPNWARGFKYSGGKNTCPENARCITVKEMYGNASNFCSQVWDHSWRVMPDDRPCMRLWFDGSKGNPNKAVAELYGSNQVDRDGHPNRASSSFSMHQFAFAIVTFTVLFL